MLTLDRTVKGAEPVDHGLELSGHVIIIEWSGKHYHVSIQNFPADAFHIILLHTGAFVAAVDAAGAGMDVSVCHIDHIHCVARFFRPLAETIRQQVGGAFFVGTALQYNDFHFPHPLFHFLFPVTDDVQRCRARQALHGFIGVHLLPCKFLAYLLEKRSQALIHLSPV